MNTLRIISLIILTIITLAGNVQAQDYLSNEELIAQKAAAVSNSQYRLVKIIQDEIAKREAAAVSLNSIPKSSEVIALEEKQKQAVEQENWTLAKSIKAEKNAALGLVEIAPAGQPNNAALGITTSVPPTKVNFEPLPKNSRETALQKIKSNDYAVLNASIPAPAAPITLNSDAPEASKLKHTGENEAAKGLKYRRSSLYTLMVNDPARMHAPIIKDAFGNSKMPQKFNSHNIGPYLINGQANSDDQTAIITEYLNTNNVAKDLISKWFNRNKEGKFNLDLIAARGMYDASAIDKAVANSSQRGNALLADAGEELIGNTFVIINDYKFTSKEEAVAKSKKASGFAKFAAGYIPGAGAAIQKGITAAETAATIAGKGYWVRTTSYLYRLVWDEETAAIFYNNYWTDENNFDPTKVESFNNSSNFKLQLVGSQTAGADVQSSIFADKNEEDLIRMATVKATDRAIAKLEKKYEEFRTKTPLYSTDPLTAKIGLKEGLEKGDRFAVLEQVLTPEGKTIYKKVGIIKATQVWDNSLSQEETAQLKKEGKLTENQYSTFKGIGKFYPGMLIKQVN